MRLILKNPETLSTEFYEIKDKKERIITLLEKKGISPLIYSVISNGKNLSLNSAYIFWGIKSPLLTILFKNFVWIETDTPIIILLKTGISH